VKGLKVYYADINYKKLVHLKARQPSYYLCIFEEVFVETFPFNCVFLLYCFYWLFADIPHKKDSRDLDMVMWLFENILFIAV